MLETIWFILLGLVGGVTFIIMHSDDWDDLTKFAAFKRIVIGGVVGCLYWLLYSEHSYPNMIMSFVCGYAGTDFINKLVLRMSKK